LRQRTCSRSSTDSFCDESSEENSCSSECASCVADADRVNYASSDVLLSRIDSNRINRICGKLNGCISTLGSARGFKVNPANVLVILTQVSILVAECSMDLGQLTSDTLKKVLRK
jgi:hypothetical protein